LVLRRGATYGGVRHALPVIVLLAIFAGMASNFAWNAKAVPLKVFVGLVFLVAVVSALPVMRPWKYLNEIVDGAEKSNLYFDDDGTDLGQRGKDVARYYHAVVEPSGDVPFISHYVSAAEKQARGIDWTWRQHFYHVHRVGNIYLNRGRAMRPRRPTKPLGNTRHRMCRCADSIKNQVRIVETEPLDKIAPLRDPGLE
jgi:hypothetical protein